MDYKALNASDKSTITKLINAKIALDDAKKAYDELVDKALDIAKNNGTITKGYTKVIYTPQGEYTTLDTSKVKSELPDLYAKYSKVVNRKEALKVLL